MDGEEIYIVHAKLERMPVVAAPCRKATLRRNRIPCIELSACPTLEDLDLYDNAITAIENLELAPNLRVLDLSFNLIRRNAVPALQRLVELYLIGNDIEAIERMDLPGLRKLDMAENSLGTIAGLEGLGSLRELYLGSNRIEVVAGIGHLTELAVLDLQNNRLREVDCAAVPPSVRTLLLSDNRDLVAIRNVHLLRNLDLISIGRTKLDRAAVAAQTRAEIWD